MSRPPKFKERQLQESDVFFLFFLPLQKLLSSPLLWMNESSWKQPLLFSIYRSSSVFSEEKISNNASKWSLYHLPYRVYVHVYPYPPSLLCHLAHPSIPWQQYSKLLPIQLANYSTSPLLPSQVSCYTRCVKAGNARQKNKNIISSCPKLGSW